MRINFKKGLASFLWVCSLCCGFAVADGQGWPRQFQNDDGSITTIPAKPQRILSTSATITGTLLAMDIPVVASATAVNGNYFAQWAPVAKSRGVEKLWSAGSVDLEAAYAMAPDLIIISSTGADSTLDQRAMLEQIAPTIVLDYGRFAWQEMAVKLGQATGYEALVASKTQAFNDYVTLARNKIQVPEGQANIVSYNGPGTINAVSTPQGAHSMLLQDLGFVIEKPGFTGESFSDKRVDFIRIEYEQLTLLKAQTTFLLRAEDDRADDFMADPVLINVPSVQSGQVYGLGKHSFRIDYFSAKEIVDSMVRRFSAPGLAAN